MSLVPFNRQDMLAHKPMTNMLDDFFGDTWRPMRNLAGAKGTGITAAMSDGVLHINVPKEESVKSAKIEIK